MPAGTDIQSVALPRLWAAIATTAITNVDGRIVQQTKLQSWGSRRVYESTVSHERPSTML